MRLRLIKQSVFIAGVFLFLPLFTLVPLVWGGSLRVNLNDGSSFEVPYYWEEGGQLKFDIPGGVAGIPKSQVASVHEVVATREFYTGALLGRSSEQDKGQADPKQALREKAVEQLSNRPDFEMLSPEDKARLLKSEGFLPEDSAPDRVFGPIYDQQGDFSQLVRLRGNGLMLVMQNVLSSRVDPKQHRFVLTIYDSEGNVIMTTPCELQELKLDGKAKSNLGIRGQIYSVMATFKPNPNMSRYEITALKR